MYCRNCGKEISNDSRICPFCGKEQNNSVDANYDDSGSVGWAILGFFIPLAGLILFLVWKDSKPRCAKKAGLGALIAVIFSVVMSIVYVICFVGIIGVGSAM